MQSSSNTDELRANLLQNPLDLIWYQLNRYIWLPSGTQKNNFLVKEKCTEFKGGVYNIQKRNEIRITTYQLFDSKCPKRTRYFKCSIYNMPY